MANYATNIFHARTENQTDLDKIEAFLDDKFNGFVNRQGNSVDAEFSSRWVYPEEEINKLVESLDAKDGAYIKILTYELDDEYVSFRIFSQGKWNIKKIAKLSVRTAPCSRPIKATLRERLSAISAIK